MTPEVLLAIIGLVTTGAGYLAGRNRVLTRTLNTVNATYEALIGQLRSEIDRLHHRVLDLESALTRVSTAPMPPITVKVGQSDDL